MTFTIRDWLWLMAVIGLGLGWIAAVKQMRKSDHEVQLLNTTLVYERQFHKWLCTGKEN